jgi:hypothetical protein
MFNAISYQSGAVVWKSKSIKSDLCCNRSKTRLETSGQKGRGVGAGAAESTNLHGPIRLPLAIQTFV